MRWRRFLVDVLWNYLGFGFFERILEDGRYFILLWELFGVEFKSFDRFLVLFCD